MRRILVLIVGLFLLFSLIGTIVYFIAPTPTPFLHQTYGQISVSFAALAVLSPLMFLNIPKSRRFSRKLAVPGKIKDLALPSFILSVTLFAIFAYITTTSHNTPTSRAALLAFYSEFPVGQGHFFFGIFGFAFFVSAFVFLMVYFQDRGPLRAFNDALKFFVFPALIIFELGLLFLDTREMTFHATMFLASTPLAGILTNWFVFVVSSGLFAIRLANMRQGL